MRTGAEGLVGQIGVVRNWAESEGSVSLHGAVWRACRSAVMDELDGFDAHEPDDAAGGLHPGDRVVVERLSGLTLAVRPAEKWELLH